ncbi:MAG: hypothetical protein HFJ42_02470 [Clostridia bacterium]|nr:hypothetical protein [Clostridia bacterium]
MTTQMRELVAEMEGVTKEDIGRKVKSESISAFRHGEIAEVIGWGLDIEKKRPVYFIRFNNNECDTIPAGKYFKDSGFEFTD